MRVWPFCTNAKVNRHPSRYLLQPHALLPLINLPCEHFGQVMPTGKLDSGNADGELLIFLVLVFLFDGVGLSKSKTTLLLSPHRSAAENSLPVRCDLNPLTTLVFPFDSSSLIIVGDMVRVDILP